MRRCVIITSYQSAPIKESFQFMDDDYIIRNDRVIAYSMYTDKAKEKWVYVMFTNKDHDPDDEDDLVEGWVKFKNFKKLNNYASVTE